MSLEQQLDIEKKLRIKAQTDFKSVMRQWKQMAQELSKQHTDAKPFHTVTDDYLKQLAEELRYDVRCFSEAYFEDLPEQAWPPPPLRGDGRPSSSILPRQYELCPVSPALVQSFIWRVLSRRVFECYRWPADEYAGQDLRGISEFLNPRKSAIPQFRTDSQKLKCQTFSEGSRGMNETGGPFDYATFQKFHTWRATTANMVFSAEALKSPRDRWVQFEEGLIKDLIDPYTKRFIPRSEYDRYFALLSNIIEKALAMDREISRQAAWVRWVFEDAERPLDTMANTVSPNAEALCVIVAPAMIKRGKSSGEGFNEEQIELLLADTCIVQNLLPSRAPRREGEDSLLYRFVSSTVFRSEGGRYY